MKRSLSLLLRSGIAAFGASLVATASAQVEPSDPLGPLPVQVHRSGPTIPQRATTGPISVICVDCPRPRAPSAFELYKQQLSARATREGVSTRTIASVIPGLTLSQRVIDLDRSQAAPTTNYTVAPFAPYRARHVTSSLINRGAARYGANAGRLEAIRQRFGVDPAVVMAIYGHETSYGAVTGNFDLAGALASLAYEGRRRAMFESEFIAVLKLIDRGYSRSRLKGSYAGATGYPQFMPTVVLRVATDGDGDGRANIWGSELDGLASIAAYLRSAGWKANVPWAVPVRTPPMLNRAAIANPVPSVKCPAVFRRHSVWKTMREWRALGLVPLGRSLPEDEPATLIEPDGRGATAYLTTQNYRAILDYNCSNFYALSVGLLADAIVGR